MKTKSSIKDLRGFLILWSTQAVSALGTAMTDYALVVWLYSREGTASSVAMLTIVTFLPTILLRFVAGAIADRWNKKHVMLLCDLLAACGTGAVFILYRTNLLTAGRLYLINLLLSLMNAFQTPASYAATSLLVPEEQYARAGGLQSASGAVISILSPALGSSLFAWGGLESVLTVDLISFSVAFCTLLLFIRLPAGGARRTGNESFLPACLSGVRYLFAHRPLMKLILFFTAINFLAKLGGDGMLAPFILQKTNGNQQALGTAQTCTALGVLAGSLLMTLIPPAKRPVRLIFITCALTFLTGNILVSLSGSLSVWCAMIFLSYLSAAVMNVHLGALMRTQVPLPLHGRVFSARDTIQNIAIPLGLYLGGLLADHVCEPMASSPLLAPVFSAGAGAGLSLLFFTAGTGGFFLSIVFLLKNACHELN